MEFCSLTEYPRGERVEIYGSEGTLVIDQVLDPPVVLYRGADDPKGTPLDRRALRHPRLEGRVDQGDRRATSSTAVRDGREPGVTAADSKYVVSLVERAYESAARRRWSTAGSRVADGS